MTRSEQRNRLRKSRAQRALQLGSYRPAIAAGIVLTENPNYQRKAANLNQPVRYSL